MSGAFIPCVLLSDDGKSVKLKSMSPSDRGERVEEIMSIVSTLWEGSKPDKPRPFVFKLGEDGKVQLRPFEEFQELEETIDRYESFFWIPDSCFADQSDQERAAQREMFAIGSLAFQILTGRKPWEGTSRGVTAQEKGEYPEAVLNLQRSEYVRILSMWSPEFGVALASEIQKAEKKKVAAKVGKQVAKTAAITGGVIAGTMLLAPIILPIIGFGAAGVGAGSAAAGWQAAIGTVEAGSLFAILQSAGAGGIAGIAALAATGTGAALAAGASAFAGKTLADYAEAQGIEKEKIWKIFQENVRKKKL